MDLENNLLKVMAEQLGVTGKMIDQLVERGIYVVVKAKRSNKKPEEANPSENIFME